MRARPSGPTTVDARVQAHHDAERDEHEREHDRERQQDPRRTRAMMSTQALPIRSAGAGAHEAAHQGDGDRHADGGRQEVLHGQAGHLRDVAHRGLGDVGLPVRVGHERHRGVERDPRVDRPAARGRGRAPPAAVAAGRAAPRPTSENAEDRHRIGAGALVGVGVDAGEAVDAPLDAPVGVVGVDAGHPVPEGAPRHGQGDQQQHGELERGPPPCRSSEPLRTHEGDEQVDQQRRGRRRRR